ncbi:MAG TPA: hypothetical protein VEC57_14835, partial [Candidatus Limnocylindrales bacterium]|nr:hypothetical protein [Candidatus Limnocylindrales bacterium]
STRFAILPHAIAGVTGRRPLTCNAGGKCSSKIREPRCTGFAPAAPGHAAAGVFTLPRTLWPRRIPALKATHHSSH